MAEVAVSRQMFAEILALIAPVVGATSAGMRGRGEQMWMAIKEEAGLGASKAARFAVLGLSTAVFDRHLPAQARFAIAQAG
jgi:hypothetical protein